MLKIRSEQIRIYQPDAEEAFVTRIIDYLRENHAQDVVRLPEAEMSIAGLSEGDLRRLVKAGIRAARSYGVEWKSNLMAFVTMMFLGAPNFDEYEKAAQILNDEKLPAEERIDKLTREISDADWAAIAENYNPFKWNLLTEEQFV